MDGGRVEAVVAGHICLDIIPALGAGRSGAEELLRPGKLVEIGAAVTSTGGAVANTGITLHRLGVPVRLVGKLGDDLFGRALLDALRACGPALAEGTFVTAGETTSYTLVISPPDLDVTFSHGRLEISGEKKAAREEKDAESYTLLERSYGSFSRAVELGEGVDAAKASASYKNGILTVKVPKAEAAKTRKIDVKGE